MFKSMRTCHANSLPVLSPLPRQREHDAPARSKSDYDLLSGWWKCRDEVCESENVMLGPMDVYEAGDAERVCTHCGTYTGGSSLAAWILMYRLVVMQ